MSEYLYWPLYDLQVKSQDLTLRLPSDNDIGEIIKLAKRGVHEAGYQPFCSAWTDLEEPEFSLGIAQHHWMNRAQLKPDNWDLSFVVLLEDQVIGTQSLRSENFDKLKTVETGSWLGKEFQGRGFGTEMRKAILFFAFDVLGAEYAKSDARADNYSSNSVSKKIGYKENGYDMHIFGAEIVRRNQYLLEAERWRENDVSNVTVSGFESCRRMLLSQ